MLIVRRKPGESLVIGDGVEVVILECGAGKRVKLGIIGPPEVNVYRKELAITQRQNRLAAADVIQPETFTPVLSRMGRGCSRREIDAARPVRVASSKKY